MPAALTRPALSASAAHVGPAAPAWVAGVWRAGELASSAQRTLDTGYPALNAALPGGGWPVGALTELLQRRPGLGEWGLLAPALASLGGRQGQRAPSFLHQHASPMGMPASMQTGRTVLVGSPHPPLGPALAARSVAPGSWLRVQASTLSERLWSAEQALRCAEVAAVLLWLPHAPAAHLRRLHLAAQTHGKLLFVFRAEDAWQHASPAPLRLRLAWAEPLAVAAPAAQGGAAPALQVQVLKRRGPPLAQPLLLHTATPAVQALLAASRAQSRLRRAAVLPVAAGLPAAPAASGAEPSLVHAGPDASVPARRKESVHAVDRLAAWS